MKLTLLIFLLITGSIAKTPKKIVKNVGKRFLDGILGGPLQKIRWNFMSDEEFNRTKSREFERIGLLIQAQSSFENWSWRESATALESLLSSDFEGSICGGVKMNYVQFLDHWKRSRWQYLQNIIQQPIKMHHLNTSSYTLATFQVSFDLHSKWEYSERAVYLVQLALRGENEVNSYTVMGIDEIEPCSHYGRIDWLTSNASLQLRLSEDDPEERAKVQKYVEELFHVGTLTDRVPDTWLRNHTAKDQFFDVKTCDEGILKAHNKLKLELWWNKFQIMWHPVDRNHTEIQLLGGGRGRYVYRVTMNLRIGHSSKRKTQAVEFKMQVQYNVHGDQLWYINKFEVMCPVVQDFTLMETHAMAIKEVIGHRMFRIVINPEMWYSVTHVFDDLISKEITEFESCSGVEGQEMEMEKVEKLNDLEHKFWQLNKATSGKMEGYDLGDKVISVGKHMLVDLYAIWTPLVKNWVHESKWTFFLAWHEHFQVYEVVKIQFGCPVSWRGKKWYSSMFYARIG